jgi:glyoxylase-like metal-dependent hydrolase (beta-lactamase superfamily II)
MARVHELSRRLFLCELGKGSVAAVVLGAGVACADDREDTSIDPNRIGAEDGPDLVWHRAALGSVSAYVLVRGRQAAIVDTGLKGSEAKIGDAVKAAGLDWPDVRHVIVTHKHPDHAGSLAAVLAAATSATVSAGEADIAAIQSPRPLEAVADGAEIFGLQIVATPGHTPGHISVFDAGAHVLVTGDAVNGSGADVNGPNPQYTEDMAKANESAKKLAALDVDTILFGHGDPIKGGARQALEKLAKTLG